MQTHEVQRENPLCENADRKVVITTCRGREVACLYQGGRLLQVECLDNGSQIGAIYIGKVKNVVKNLNACFVEIADKELCYLPLEEAKAPFLLNRSFDGRILQGDELVVQVKRDALKTKQASLTCEISLQGKHFVYALGNPKVGISNKLSKELRGEIKVFLQERNRIDEQGCLYGKENLPAYGCVIRTEAGKCFQENKEAFWKEFLDSEEVFLQLLEKARFRTCFSCVQAPKKPYEAILDKMCISDEVEVVTDLPEAYTSLQGVRKELRYYMSEDFSLEKLYTVENKLQEALSEKVWLKSGAYLVIEQTECLTTIDVNSGKMIKEKDKETAIWKINEEAAREAALQIRLRNLSGIIIIDFINMAEKSKEEQLIAFMKEQVTKDVVLTKVVDITALGLMELTRKKTRPSLQEQWK